MALSGMLGRKRFWAGVLAALLGAGGFYFGRDLEIGRQSLLLSRGDLAVFAERSISLALLLAALAVLTAGAGLRWWQSRLARRIA